MVSPGAGESGEEGRGDLGGRVHTGFSFAVEGGEGAEGGDEDAEVGERNEEGEPVHGCVRSEGTIEYEGEWDELEGRKKRRLAQCVRRAGGG